MSLEIRIVLVEPPHGASVGAIARAMRNFGHDVLTLVGPRSADADDDAIRWASGADDVLARAQRATTLAAALTTATSSIAILRERFEHRGARGVPRLALCPRYSSVSIVFEPDERDFTAEERGFFERTATIGAPGLDLVQRVALTCWEMSRVAPAGDVAREAASASALDRVDREIDWIIRRSGATSHEESLVALREILGRARPSAREATMALGVLRQLGWALGQVEGDGR